MKTATKESLRAQAIKKREELSQRERQELSKQILNRLISLPQLSGARSVLLFYPHRGEPDIRPLISKLILEGYQTLFPKVVDKGLKLVRVEREEDLKPGAFGILEPSQGEEVEPEKVELALVPGLLFDKEGYRLGYGKAYYDRLLGRLGGLKVGVCYEFQVVEEVPRDSWDEPVDLVVTDANIYTGGKAV
ncbi:MAG: 5-formyltetrahydrofolate cyclo-ligase [Aquificaceae bacterium]|nr:5-formyltetrahydrofolate cyclo-ligase [Aquificaceae bacterium]